ncbi:MULTISPECIES: hypothetical protein [Paenibacillus]|uniref:Uncharacterized protein n=1 Tax=Paenibacillus woosongensis TaxID=307580 RepID=A0A7X2Z2Y9_9BACL|nr:hypothetical protein [Paenibacillus woosongensis]MUG46521.1 hypothetical protein [Paenibacillus woosongensis]
MNEEMLVDQGTLVEAWQQQLPDYLNPGDTSIVQADLADPYGLRIHINAEGRQDYSFDFQCTYMDRREVKVQLVDVEREGATVNEQSEQVQNLTEDYVRHIHECAQALQRITNP